MKDVYRLGGIAALVLLVFGAATLYYLRSEEQAQSERVQEQASLDPAVFERPYSRTKGPADAKVTLVEFFDPECEACRQAHGAVQQLLEHYDGRLRLVLRYMPFHENSVYAAGALEAAGAQGRYWEMLDVLFKNQPDWGNHHAPRPDLIPGYAREIGLDMDAFQQFIDAGAYRDLIETDRADGEALGVKGTPTFFVNQRPLTTLSIVALRLLIEEELL